MCRVIALGDGERVVLVAAAWQVAVAGEAVGADDRARLAGVLDEIEQRLRLHIRDHLDPSATEEPLLVVGRLHPLYRDRDDELAFSATATLAAGRRPAEVALIDLDLTAQPISVPPRTLHREPQLVQHQPCGWIADPEFALKMLRAHTALRAAHKPRGPEPGDEAHPRPLEDRARDQRGLFLAPRADVGSTARTPRFRRLTRARATARAGEALGPAKLREVERACRVVREPVQELPERPRVLPTGARRHEPSCY